MVSLNKLGKMLSPRGKGTVPEGPPAGTNALLTKDGKQLTTKSGSVLSHKGS